VKDDASCVNKIENSLDTPYSIIRGLA